jgi:hypothetical protein
MVTLDRQSWPVMARRPRAASQPPASEDVSTEAKEYPWFAAVT